MYKFTFKEDIDLNDLTLLEPATWILFLNCMLYCKRNDLEFRITSLINDRKSIKAISQSHESGRAFDMSHRSTGNWNNVHRNRMAYELNRDFSEIGAISFSDNISRPCVLKDTHFHVQVRPNANVDKFIK